MNCGGSRRAEGGSPFDFAPLRSGRTVRSLPTGIPFVLSPSTSSARTDIRPRSPAEPGNATPRCGRATTTQHTQAEPGHEQWPGYHHAPCLAGRDGEGSRGIYSPAVDRKSGSYLVSSPKALRGHPTRQTVRSQSPPTLVGWQALEPRRY